MEQKQFKSIEGVEIRSLLGLTRGLSNADLEALTVKAICTHRRLVEDADRLYHDLPEEYKIGKIAGGAQHLSYIEASIEASIEMHAQMSVVNTLISILGYIPKVNAN
ncbi:transcriptional repressor TraM [Agrobacterium vitis]|uniref:transcriptional repressor TraM n=1 Tax=Agrobacterium vitis TaxID=373 RepID=UPI0015DA06E3|nr:transcriptional repressor TraM [Agrobacterium vitis]MCF1455928.1 transcriptional regulator [Agrobacterium vitis]BCH56751.1 transcriptional repressor TraM [Agrobacterium vitis]